MKKEEDFEKILNYLAICNQLKKTDLIIGFGHFDMRIPDLCSQLFQKGYGKKILFTGGIGTGSADLDVPEAIAFKEVALKNGVSEKDIIIESKSTNTGENIDFSLEILKNLYPPFIFKNAIIIASPYRQRRVFLACKKRLPEVSFINYPPQTTFEIEAKIFADKKEDLKNFLFGEVDRIVQYGQREYIEKEDIPEDILKICSTTS